MRIARRLAGLEAVLSPTELVCRWLDGAHAFDDLTAYTRWLFDRCAMLAGKEPSASSAADLADTLGLIQARVRSLAAIEVARTTVEAKYLDGHPCLFPAESRRWDAARLATAELAELAAKLSELDCGAEASDIDEPPSEGEVALYVEELVEPAKVTALEKLDAGRRAFRIATRWLRPRLLAELGAT